MPTSTEKLLSVVWGNRKGFVFLPSKDALDEGYPKRGWHEAKGIPYEGKVPPLSDLPAHSDLYFCPVVFSEPTRRKEYAQSTNCLWSDLDTATPQSCKLRPSVAWQSSPGRYQALWFLQADIDPNEAAELSKRIAYGDGADKGGWDLTQVLRIPGTVNYKYPMKPPVSLLWARNTRYTSSQVRAAYPPVNGSSSTSTVQENSTASSTSSWPIVPEKNLNSAISSLPIGIRTKLFGTVPQGADRSTELQKLARDILKFGISSNYALLLLQRSTWNKFAGRFDEQEMLLRQVSDAQTVLDRRAKEKTDAQTVTGPSEDTLMPEMQTWKWGDFLSIPTTLRWLVQDSWVDGTVGFISGRSKSYKTWIGLDLALSVLSGQPFLGVHPVARTGPVLLIQEEDPTAILQERLKLIAKAKNMLPSAEITGQHTIRVDWNEYPLTVINVQGFDLTSPQKVAQVRRLIGDINPVMVMLDPLINMMGTTDEHRATEVVALLREIKQWREQFGCNVVVVHHWNKTATVEGDRGGAHMYGSFANHAWLESALHVEPYIEPDTTHVDTVTIEREFKAAPGSRSQRLKFHIDTLVDFSYMVESLGDSINATAQSVLDLITNAEQPVTTGEIQVTTGFSRTTVSEEVNKLVRRGLITAVKGGGRGRQSSYTLKEQPKGSP